MCIPAVVSDQDLDPSLINNLDSAEAYHALQDSPLPTVVVFTTVMDCVPCISLFPKLIRAAEHLDGMVPVATVDCEQHRTLCSKAGVRSMPYIQLLPARKQKNPYTNAWQKLPVEYSGPMSARGMVDAALAMLPDRFVSQVWTSMLPAVHNVHHQVSSQ